MRTHHKFTAIFSVAVLSISLLTVSVQSAKAATNQVSILSGQGGAGEFTNPSGVSVAPDGSVYVADRENFEIKRVVSGKVTTFARTAPTADGNVLNSFCGVYAKSSDEIWASNCENSKVHKYNSAGSLVRTYVLALPFKSVCVSCIDWSAGIVVDDFGGIFLTDEFNDVILRIDQATGQTSVWAGQPGVKGSQNGDAKSSTFNLPRGIAIDSRGNLLVADQSNGSIRRITPQGVVSTVQSGIPRPVGVAIDSSDSIYVTSDIWDGSIITKVGQGRIYDDSAATINYGVNGTVVGQLTYATNGGLAIDSRGTNPSNNIYVTDLLNHSIKIFSSSGKLIGRFGSEDSYGVSAPGTSKQFYMHPNHTFPLADGTYLVLDNFTIKHIGPTGVILKVTRLEKGCWYANGAAFTPDGTFFCAQGNTIEVRFPNGTWTTIGNATAGKADGNSSSARFRLPEGMAVFKGSVYVADIGNRQIRKVTRIAGTSDFQVTTVLGTGTWDGGGDVMARSKANFASPTRIAIDGNGNLYIADGGVDSIYKTSVVQDSDVTRVGRYIGSWPSSMVADGDGIVYVSGWGGKIYKVENNKMTYFAGSGVGNKLGAADTSVFNRPTGLSIDIKGQLIVADRDSQLIKKISIDGEPNFYTATPASAYSAYMSATPTQSQGFTAEQEKLISEKYILTNQTGLISRIYQSSNTEIPAKDVAGLNLCAIGTSKSGELDKNSGFPRGGGCDNNLYLMSYKGYITFPNTGSSGAKRFYISAPGGALLRIGEKVVIDKWSESAGNETWPFDKFGDFKAESGKQYPIEVLYFRHTSMTSAKGLKLYWSTNEKYSASNTEVIPEKYFSPSKSESANIVAPVSPSGPTVSVNLNFINLKVKVPDNATSVVLYAPEFGVTKVKPLIGKIKSGFATFEVAVSTKFAGKKGILQLVTGNAVGESKPLKVPVTVPKVVTKPAPKVTPIAKPPAQQTVVCEKGGIKRSFDAAECPPGYTRG